MFFLLLRAQLLTLVQILDGDGVERTHQTEEDTLLMQKLAAESIVLLKNDTGLLPIKPKVCILSII